MSYIDHTGNMVKCNDTLKQTVLGLNIFPYSKAYSICLIGNQLKQHLSRVNFNVLNYPEPSNKFKQYWSRYYQYPKYCRGLSADLFHVLDHSMGDLVKDLPADKTTVTCHDLISLIYPNRVPIRGKL